MEILKIIITASVSFIYLFIIASLLGKKQVAQLNVVDYVVGISVGNIAGEWCVDNSAPWYQFALSILVFFLLSTFITFLERKVPFKKYLKGKQIEIISNGKINYKNLKKSKLDINDLLGLCRAKNYFDLKQISYLFFENNGEISILPDSRFSPVVLKDIKQEFNSSSTPKYLIIDGHIDKSSLDSINKDISWLKEKCSIKYKKDLYNIILAEYNDTKDEVIIHYKSWHELIKQHIAHMTWHKLKQLTFFLMLHFWILVCSFT